MKSNALLLACASLSVLGACATMPSGAIGIEPLAAEPVDASVPVLDEDPAPVSTDDGPEYIAGIVVGSPATTPSPAPSSGQDAAAAASTPQTVHEAVRMVFEDPAFGERLAQSYLAVTDVEPRVTSVEYEQIIEILDAVDSEKYDEALRLIEEYGSAPESNAVFDFTRANIFFQQDRHAEAAAAYQTAADKFPRFLRAWQGLGQIHARAGNFDLAIPPLVKVLELGGGDAVTYGLLGIAHLNVGSYLSAESAFRMAALLDPATIEWQLYLADCFFKQERFRDAIALIEGLLAEDPDRSELWLLQAGAYLRLGEPLRAAENYELVAGLGLADADTLSTLGDIYVNEGLYEPGVNAHLRALNAASKTTVDRAIRAAKSLSSRGATDGVKSLIAGIENTAGDSIEQEAQKDLLKLRAMIAVAEGDAEEEVRVLEETVALDPLDGEAIILLGKYSARTGDPERAEFLFERAANIEGFEAEAKKSHGELLVNLGRYQEGLVFLRRSFELQPRGYLQDYIDKVERITQNR